MTDIEAYRNLIASKAVSFDPRGLGKVPPLNQSMFPHQAACTDFALRAGCSGLFLATGLGKSLCSLDWGRVIVEHTNRPVLMLAPLAVSKQHEREAEKFGIDATAIREPSEIRGARVYVTNYERIDRFSDAIPSMGGVILDESSILKAFTGKTSRKLRQSFASTPYRLAASATPAPNDHMEIGQQSEFLGVMESPEMLSRWFIADQSEMGRYRIKAAARRAFWDWVASWARCLNMPSDLGFDDSTHVLPAIETHTHIVSADRSLDVGEEKTGQSRLFRIPDMSATSIHKEKRLTANRRAGAIAEVVSAEPNEPWIIWVDTDYDADAIMPLLPDAIEVRGNMRPDEKEDLIMSFVNGASRILVTKPSIAGMGLNLQHCARMAFTGLSFSFEGYHQSVRRCWRFGQHRTVHVHVAMADTERSILDVINAKSGRFDAMRDAMKSSMMRAHRGSRVLDDYNPTMRMAIPEWLGAA
jgi:hypothetical protein